MMREETMQVETACKNCGERFCVPVSVPSREPCRCGMTETARIVRYVVMAFIALILALFGGCWFDHYYTTEQVKAVKGVGYTVEPKQDGGPLLKPFVPEMDVRKVEEKKP